jgi:hypothetical protein
LARTPRPVNPADGPIQAFAHDLRSLREAAGNPTYRVLAKTAGFSATTLGDAAGGVRLPTLELAVVVGLIFWRLPAQAKSTTPAAHHASAPAESCPSPFTGAEGTFLASSISLSIATGSSGAGIVGLQASGIGVWIVGFAAYYPGTPGDPPAWHQVGTMTDTPGFAVLLRSGLLNSAPGANEVPVITVACLGGSGATNVYATGMVQLATPAKVQPWSIAPAELASAQGAACQYPAPAAVS